MGTFNEHINPQGYNLGGSPANENPFFEFEGGGGGGVSPENINITGQAEYDSTATNPSMTVNKTSTDDSVSFNLDVKIPEVKASSGGVEVTMFKFSNLETLLREIITRLYPTPGSGPEKMTFSLLGNYVNNAADNILVDNTAKEMYQSLGWDHQLSTSNVAGIRIYTSDNTLRYAESKHTASTVSAFDYYDRWGVSNSGPFTGVILVTRFNEDAIDFSIILNINADAQGQISTSNERYDHEQTTIELDVYYQYSTDTFLGGTSASYDFINFLDMAGAADGFFSWYGGDLYVGGKGWRIVLGISDNENTGFNTACALLDRMGYFNFIAQGTKEQIDYNPEVQP